MNTGVCLPAGLNDIPHILSSTSVAVALFSETWLLPNKRINIPGYPYPN